MNKVLSVLILLIGLGIGRLLSNPILPIPQKLILVGAGLVFAYCFAYCDDLLSKWRVQDGQVSG